MSVRNSIIDRCFLPIKQRLAVFAFDTTEPDPGEFEAEEMSHQQNLHNDVAAGTGVAAGGSCSTDRNENHEQGYYPGKPYDRRRSSVSSITNDCAPISYHGTGLIGYSYHGDEEYFFNSSTPPPVEAEDAVSTSCQVKMQQNRSQQNHNEPSSSNGDIDHPNTITIIPSSNSNPAAPQTQRKNIEGGIKYRAGRLPWYHMSNQYHFKTHPNTDTSVSSTPPMTPERNSLCTNAWKRHCININDSSVGIAAKVPGAAAVHSFPGSNLPFEQTENGRQLVVTSFEGASNVDSDSLSCTIGSSTNSGVAGFGSFVYRKVKDSSRQNKIMFGLIAFVSVAAFSAAVVGLLETTDSHSDRSMNPTFVPENDLAQHSPSTAPTHTPTGTNAMIMLEPSPSLDGWKTLLPTIIKSYPPARNPYSTTLFVDEQLEQHDENNDKNLTSSGDVVPTTTNFSPKPTINSPLVPSTHLPIQHITSKSPTNQSTTRSPTKHPTGKPSYSLPSSRPTPQPTRTTRKPTFEPSTLSPVSMEPTANPSMRRPSPSPITAGGPPTVFPIRYVEQQFVYLLRLLYELLLQWYLSLLLNTSITSLGC